MGSHRRLSWLPAVLLLAAAAPGRGQPSPEVEVEGEEIEVTEVLVDVLATDRKGRVVEGLGREDFTVEVEGEPAEVTGATFYSTRYAEGAEEGTVTEPAAVPSSRYFILFFHDQQGSGGGGVRLYQQQVEAGREAHEWIREGLAGSDWVAVVAFDQRLVIHQDFTQHRGSLLAAVGAAALGESSGTPPPSRRRRALAGTGPALLRGLPDLFDLEGETRRVYDALRVVAEATGAIVGRKNLLLFTPGLEDPGAPANRPDPRYYPAMVRALNDHNVAVYPIDLTPSGMPRLQPSLLSQLADDTGGRYYDRFVSFATPLERIGEESTGYYLLSFRAPHPAGESGYREIRVRCEAQGVRVRARRGFRYGEGAEEDPRG